MNYHKIIPAVLAFAVVSAPVAAQRLPDLPDPLQMMQQYEIQSQLQQLREAQERQIELQQELLAQQKKQYNDARYEACRRLYERQIGGVWPC